MRNLLSVFALTALMVACGSPVVDFPIDGVGSNRDGGDVCECEQNDAGNLGNTESDAGVDGSGGTTGGTTGSSTGGSTGGTTGGATDGTTGGSTTGGTTVGEPDASMPGCN